MYYSLIQVPIKMDETCNDFVKACFKKAELIYKRFYHIVLLEICKSFNLMPKGLEANKSFWEVTASANVNLSWLIKIRSHLDKIEK